MEVWDLYTKYREKTGKEHIRGVQIPQGYYHLVVHVWIPNRKCRWIKSAGVKADGKIFIEKRY